MPSKIILLRGHIVDSLTLSKVLDIILNDKGDYEILRFEIGKTRDAMSEAEIRVSAADSATLEQIIQNIQQHGADTEESTSTQTETV